MRLLPFSLALLVACDGSDTSLKVYQNPPVASITSPTDGSIFPEETPIDFLATVDDREDAAPDLALTWASTVDGVLTDEIAASADGSVLFTANGLSVGTHTITLTATDEGASTGESSVTITIEEVPDAPNITVIHPASGEYGRDDEDFGFSATVTDNQDTYDLLAVSVESTSTGPACTGMADGLGDFACSARLPSGNHDLIFTVTDSTGLSASVGAFLEVRRAASIDDDGDGWNEDQGDCDDGNGAISPAANETDYGVNGIDDDCDGIIDNTTTGYDDDGDGYSEVNGDCDDDDAASHPNGVEVYDARDNDCDGTIDDQTDYYDDDGDGMTEVAGDCDDTSIATLPDAVELEDGEDNDCDGIIDEGTAAIDDDGDGMSENFGDCDDTDIETYLGAPENYQDYVDQDCNGIAEADFDDDGYLSITTGGADCDDGDEYTFPGAAEYEVDPTLCTTDADEDGYASNAPLGTVEPGTDCDDSNEDISPEATEECDNDDNNCDGAIDEINADGCTDYFYDYDGDSYGSDSVASQCSCDPTGYYTSPYNTDCYDYNASANPTITTYSSSTRGDTSFDWNCDSTEEKYFKGVASCNAWPLCTNGSGGWANSLASCGTSASYISACAYNGIWSCGHTYITETQRCR